MRHKLFKKQLGSIALIVFLSLSSVLVILTFIFNNYFADEKYNSLFKSCDSVSNFVKHSTDIEARIIIKIRFIM